MDITNISTTVATLLSVMVDTAVGRGTGLR